MSLRSVVKRGLVTVARDHGPATGATLLIYHRIGGGTDDELDLPVDRLASQLDVLVAEGHDVLSLDAALDRLDVGDGRPSVVLTFDDGFADVFTHAWPLLQERRLPFTVYVSAGLIGAQMRWEGSTASSQGSRALDWAQLTEMQASGLCTVGNHTWDHAAPDVVDVAQLDRCSDEIEARLGRRPAHFAWTWGIEVPSLLPAVRARFRSAATGALGRNDLERDRWALCRVPVRRTDPMAFFSAKLQGNLGPEQTYAGLVLAAKRAMGWVRRG
jgi:peptidoglycan/xylan/chitin deacetylase (PgdA/CDA1 family)